MINFRQNSFISPKKFKFLSDFWQIVAKKATQAIKATQKRNYLKLKTTRKTNELSSMTLNFSITRIDLNRLFIGLNQFFCFNQMLPMLMDGESMEINFVDEKVMEINFIN